MAHTVMCVCTVYFTAIVGCAFSFPKLTGGESQTDDATEKDNAVETTVQETTKVAEATSSVDHEDQFPVLNDTGGGLTDANIPNLNENVSESGLTTISSESDGSSQNAKHNLKQLDEKEIQILIRNRHLEEVKDQILSKLRLTYPPKLLGGMPQLPLDEIKKVYFELNNDESYKPHSHFYAKTVRKFIVGEDVTHTCITKKSTGCYHFDLRGRVAPSEVQTVQLWIYKLFNHNDPYTQTFVISELEKVKRSDSNLRIKNLVERFDTTQKYGWIKIDITKSAMRWLLKPRLNHGIAVICKGCQRKNYKTIFSTKNDTRPFLVVTTRKFHNRSKRDATNICTEQSTECCLMPFTINFREIGWDAVAYPHSMQANYCTGSCHARYSSTTNHTNLIQSFRWTAATANEMAALTPCCSPISYRAQSILYFDGDKLQEARIPNIAATACGCV